MIHTIRCNTCGHVCTANGWEEPETNSAGINDDESLDDECVHLVNGGEFEIIESEFGFNN